MLVGGQVIINLHVNICLSYCKLMMGAKILNELEISSYIRIFAM